MFLLRVFRFYTTFAEKSVEIKKNTYNYMIEIIEKYFPNLTEEQKKQFEALDALYRDWNSKINVISRKDIDNLYEHHVLHSLAIAKAINFPSGHGDSRFRLRRRFPRHSARYPLP